MSEEKSNNDYEYMINRLEEIVNEMETEELTLEQSIEHYESGIKLANELYKVLNKAEGKIRLLAENGEQDFNIDNIEK